jgi:L-threonylcarbamoyladenylate synthase
MAALAPLEGTGRLFFCGASRDRWLGKFPPPGPSPEIRVLSPAGDTAEAAANLFETLHELDLRGLTRILAEEAPPLSLGPAINDRLRRAAAR